MVGKLTMYCRERGNEAVTVISYNELGAKRKRLIDKALFVLMSIDF